MNDISVETGAENSGMGPQMCMKRNKEDTKLWLRNLEKSQPNHVWKLYLRNLSKSQPNHVWKTMSDLCDKFLQISRTCLFSTVTKRLGYQQGTHGWSKQLTEWQHCSLTRLIAKAGATVWHVFESRWWLYGKVIQLCM